VLRLLAGAKNIDWGSQVCIMRMTRTNALRVCTTTPASLYGEAAAAIDPTKAVFGGTAYFGGGNGNQIIY
jgi:hypothetical protein